MIIGTFFSRTASPFIMMSLYLVGIVVAVIMSKLFTKFMFKGEDTPFVMEASSLPFPDAESFRPPHVGEGQAISEEDGRHHSRGVDHCVGAELFSPPSGLGRPATAGTELSVVDWQGSGAVFMPQGFNWKLDVGLLAGVGAKEIVASTMGVLYSNDDSFPGRQRI